MKKYLKSGKAATYLGVPHRTFKYWVKTGKLIPDIVTNGGHNLFSEENLARFKATKEKTGNETDLNAQNGQEKIGSRQIVPSRLSPDFCTAVQPQRLTWRMKKILRALKSKNSILMITT